MWRASSYTLAVKHSLVSFWSDASVRILKDPSLINQIDKCNVLSNNDGMAVLDGLMLYR